MSTRASFSDAPLYAVLFDGDVSGGPYEPLLTRRYGPDDHPVTVPHGFDREAAAALAGLWYCLHLPNTFQELIAAPVEAPEAGRVLDLGHQVVLAPLAVFDAAHLGPSLARGVPILAVCSDDLLDEARRRCQALGFALPPTSHRDLCDARLAEHWRAITRLVPPDPPYIGREPALTRRLDLAPAGLPGRWLNRQMSLNHSERYTEGPAAQARAIYATLEAHALARTLRRLSEDEVMPEAAESLLPTVLQQQRDMLRLPVAAAFPGVAPGYVRRAYDRSLRDRVEDLPESDPNDTFSTAIHERADALVERNAIEFMTTHRALARTGVGLVFPSVSKEAFQALALIEDHMKAPRPSGKTVWRLLDRLARKSAYLWSEDSIAAIARASTLTAFSNFPIGLLRLPGDASPLAARIPIAYRPLLPLTRAVQFELEYVPPVDFSRSIRVLVAECIPDDDRVGVISRQAWSTTVRFLADAGSRLSVSVAETLSVPALREAIANRRPDVLIISAHGVAGRGAAGLAVGDEVVVDPGLGRLPPVVILSACHVSPRGAGTISVVDLLLRDGAVAVLGTQVPVDVRHNAVLMARLLVNISEVLEGRAAEANLLEVWHRVQTSNAINDVLESTAWLSRWGRTRDATGVDPMSEFMLNRSSGRINLADIYADTEAILGEIGDDHGVGDRVRAAVADPGYVPESLFYAFYGQPERVHLRSLVALLGET